MKRGRPFEPGNKLGKGRPQGSHNQKTVALQQVLDEHAPALLRKALVMALQGDVPLLRMLVGSKLPRVTDVPVTLGDLPVRTPEELLQAHQLLITKVASGEITPVQAQQISGLLNTQRQFIETHELTNRIEALEQRLPK